MLTPEATETPIPLTGEVRPTIGPTAQTGARTALDDADWAGSSQKLRKGSGQCGHIRQSAAPDGRMGRPSGECRLGQAELAVAQKFVEAADIYAKSPGALLLRAMNIIYETTKERGATILIPTSMIDAMNPGGLLGLATAASKVE